ncbi:MAG TPA: hypothetical protein VIB79_03370 [Candidatus Binatia bacterium]
MKPAELLVGALLFWIGLHAPPESGKVLALSVSNPRSVAGNSERSAARREDDDSGPDGIRTVAESANSGRRRPSWHPPLILPSEKDISDDSQGSPAPRSTLSEVFRRSFPVIAGLILLLLAIMGFQAWRQNTQKKAREASYKAIIERDWESVDGLSAVLEKMEDLRAQAKDWTAEQFKSYRQNDVTINSYDYDKLWDIWKRYEIRGYEPEIHALAGSKWSEEQIFDLMNFYVREMKVRWEILREKRSQTVE